MNCQQSTIQVYDSFHGYLPEDSKKLIADIMQSPCPKIEVQYIDVQKQKRESDCGLFAIVFATSPAQDPASIIYDQAKMRTQLMHCFETHSTTPFPSSGSRRPKAPNIEAYSIYCVCRMINGGTPTIQCSSCTESGIIRFAVLCLHSS